MSTLRCFRKPAPEQWLVAMRVLLVLGLPIFRRWASDSIIIDGGKVENENPGENGFIGVQVKSMSNARTQELRAASFVSCVLMLLCGCGGGNPSSDVFVTVNPSSAVIKLNTGQQFSASISGTSSVSVTWNVNGVPGGSAAAGTITSAGLYTSPASVPSGGAVTVTAISQADATSSGSASVAILPPFVTIPSAQQWTVSSGSYTFSAASRIVIDAASAAELTTTANVFAADLKYLTGVSIQPVVGSPNAGDISLRLLATLDTGLGAEGYSMSVAGTVSISANTDAGVFYGTRTLLQLCRRDLRSLSGRSATGLSIRSEH